MYSYFIISSVSNSAWPLNNSLFQVCPLFRVASHSWVTKASSVTPAWNGTNTNTTLTDTCITSVAKRRSCVVRIARTRQNLPRTSSNTSSIYTLENAARNILQMTNDCSSVTSEEMGTSKTIIPLFFNNFQISGMSGLCIDWSVYFMQPSWQEERITRLFVKLKLRRFFGN